MLSQEKSAYKIELHYIASLSLFRYIMYINNAKASLFYVSYRNIILLHIYI